MKTLRILLLFLLAYAPWTGAEQRVAEEYTLKAAYLYNFAKFVKWPDEVWQGIDVINLCVFGEDPFGEALDKVRTRKAQGRSISVNLLGDAVPQPGQCHILFISRDHSADWRTLRSEVSGYPMLTVSDMSGFIDETGMVGFVNVDQRIKFEVNLGSSKSVGLSISSFLLKLAKNVRSSAQ